MKPSADALLLFCHGARANSWRVPFDDLLAQVRAQSSQPVELAFLEFMQPSFLDAVQKLHQNGATTIRVVLLFLSEGGHTRRDVGALVDQALAAWPKLRIDVSETMLASASFRSAAAAWVLEQALLA